MNIKSAEKVFANKQVPSIFEKIEKASENWKRNKKIIVHYLHYAYQFGPETGEDIASIILNLTKLLEFEVKLLEEELPKHLSLVQAWAADVVRRKGIKGTQSTLNQICDHHNAISKKLLEFERPLYGDMVIRGQDRYKEIDLIGMEEEYESSIDELIGYFPLLLRIAKVNFPGHASNLDVVYTPEDVTKVKNAVLEAQKSFETISKTLETVKIKIVLAFKSFNKAIVALDTTIKFGDDSLYRDFFYTVKERAKGKDKLSEAFVSMLDNRLTLSFIFFSTLVSEAIALTKHTDSFYFGRNC